ncbi:hypothetical protein HXY33_01545 [Candidatus Bathyarchaeota archaeon]|nr:hypothetical protein [Candidatus Bathyarchaeota archaeon]
MVIQQHTIATTQKYNFPHPTTDTTLPQRLVQLSLQTLTHTIPNTPIQLNQQVGNIEPNTLQLNPQPIMLKPKYEPTIVAAVDTSNIKFAETATGILIAVRGANVWKQNHNYHYMRFGPLIFHITEENKKQLYETMQKAYLNTLHLQSTPTLQQMPTRIANLLEKWLQNMLTKTITNGLILFDGSLTSGTPDTPITLMRETLQTARKHASAVLAFSKMTTLRFNGHLITDIHPEYSPPYMLETTGLRFKPPITLFGDIYVARLTKGNYAFRLDIDKEINPPQRIQAVEKLLTNDIISQSYPETLRLAHILCTFTANEVIAMQHFAQRKHGLKIVNRPDMHRLLFGSFGKGEQSA